MLLFYAFVCVTEIVHVRLYVCLIVFACVEFFVCVLWYRCALFCLCLAARFSFGVLSLFLFSSYACVRAVWLLSVCCVLFVGACVCGCFARSDVCSRCRSLAVRACALFMFSSIECLRARSVVIGVRLHMCSLTCE